MKSYSTLIFALFGVGKTKKKLHPVFSVIFFLYVNFCVFFFIAFFVCNVSVAYDTCLPYDKLLYIRYGENRVYFKLGTPRNQEWYTDDVNVGNALVTAYAHGLSIAIHPESCSRIGKIMEFTIMNNDKFMPYYNKENLTLPA